MSSPAIATAANRTLPIHSMTGYASLRIDAADRLSLTLTLKSVNHRFLDLQLRLPPNSDTIEPTIRRMLKEKIQRGHVEFGLQLDRQTQTAIAIDDEQVAAYVATFRTVASANGLDCQPDLNDVLRLPGMMTGRQGVSHEAAEEVQAAVIAELPTLLSSFNAMRAQEGAALAGDLRASMLRLDAVAAEVSLLREGARAATYERLRTRIAELTESAAINEDRMLAEAALLADRSDIEEELVRLRTHVAAFLAMLDQGGPLGKRLDFLLQELNREANTLLSKTGGAASQNGLRITDLGLEMKVEIERAREQIQNIE